MGMVGWWGRHMNEEGVDKIMVGNMDIWMGVPSFRDNRKDAKREFGVVCVCLYCLVVAGVVQRHVLDEHGRLHHLLVAMGRQVPQSQLLLHCVVPVAQRVHGVHGGIIQHRGALKVLQRGERERERRQHLCCAQRRAPRHSQFR